MFIVITLIPVSAIPIRQEKNNNKILSQEIKTIDVEIYDFSGKKITKTVRSITSEQKEEIIKLFFETEMIEELFYKQSIERLSILSDNKIISLETADKLSNIFQKQTLYYGKHNKKAPTGLLFDVANIFTLIFIGLKGEKQGLFEINIPDFDFYNGTISGRFALLGSYEGSGLVFTLGLFGFRRIYELNLQKYTEFPHMPNIKGTNLGFVGIFIDIPIGDESSKEHYYLVSGIALLSIWNITES